MARPKKNQRIEKGTGSFRYNRSGTLEYRFPYRDEDNVARRKSVTGKNERECLDKADKFLKWMEKKRKKIDLDATIPEILKERYELDLDLNYVGEAGYGRNINN
jgi:hypothetical protein